MMPMHSFGMKISQMKQKKTPVVSSHNPTTYQTLIAALQNTQAVAITDFLRCLEDAKKQNLSLYFISQDLINASKLKDQILALFQINTSYFKAHKIEAGFICVVNKEIYNSSSSAVLTIQTKKPNLDEKLAILATFNIKQSTTDKQIQQIDSQNILSFPLAAKSELEDLYDAIVAEGERIKKLAQEKKEAEKETPSEPEKEIIPEPIVEIVQPEKQQEQIALAEKYSPLAQQIQSMGGAIPGELKNQANEWIKKLNTGSLEPSEIDQAQKFFTDLAARRKKIEEEAAAPTTQKIIEPPKKISYMDLITRLQNNETITISDFLQYLNDAKKEKKAFYFIPTNFINSTRLKKLKDNIETLFEITTSNADIFKDETGNVLFKAYTAPGGFICLVSTNLYGNIYPSSVVLNNNPTQPDLDTKLMILNTFNIKKSDTDTQINNINNKEILSFPLEANIEIEGLYDTVIAEIEGVKELIEKKLALKKASLKPEPMIEEEKTKSITTQPQSLTPTTNGMDIYIIPLG